MLFMLLIQSAATPPPDIQLDVNATVREVRIERKGTTSLEVRAGPDSGSRIEVDRPEANGRTRLRNVNVRVQAEARIGDPQNPAPAPATESPQ